MSDCEACPLHPPRRRFLSRMSAAVVLMFGGGRVSEKRYPIPAGDGVTIDSPAQVVLVRFAQHVYAFAQACPHKNAALRWRGGDGRFQCPKHESTFKPDGTFIAGRAKRHMDRLPIRRAGDDVIVDVDASYKSDAQPAEWAAATVAL
jgi:nitrite reductase/ring-hydroxylating ferredoxin subunit